jgi:hypothetical protein
MGSNGKWVKSDDISWILLTDFDIFAHFENRVLSSTQHKCSMLYTKISARNIVISGKLQTMFLNVY